MPIYDQGKADSDGRGMSRALDRMRAQVRALQRNTNAGDIPDPTPPAEDMEPTALSALSITKGFQS